VNIKELISTSEEAGRRGTHNNWTQEEKKHFGDSSNTFANIVIGSTEFNRELGVVYSSFFTPIEACPSPYFIFVVVV